MVISFDLTEIDLKQIFEAEKQLRQLGVQIQTEYKTKTNRRTWSLKKK